MEDVRPVLGSGGGIGQWIAIGDTVVWHSLGRMPFSISSVLLAKETSATASLLPSWREGVVALCGPHHADFRAFGTRPTRRRNTLVDPEHAHWTRQSIPDACSRIHPHRLVQE
jgi:hypothetical protein